MNPKPTLPLVVPIAVGWLTFGLDLVLALALAFIVSQLVLLVEARQWLYSRFPLRLSDSDWLGTPRTWPPHVAGTRIVGRATTRTEPLSQRQLRTHCPLPPGIK